MSEKSQPVTERQIRADSIKDNIFRLICLLVIILTSPFIIGFTLQGYYITSFLDCGNFFWIVAILNRLRLRIAYRIIRWLAVHIATLIQIFDYLDRFLAIMFKNIE